jgi:hypothetical protein
MSVTRKELLEALEIATNQAQNHAMQVSGCWSIDGKEFCEKYAFLNYDDAEEAQDEANRDSFYDFLYERKSQYRNITGSDEIPAEVEDQIWNKAESEFYFESESFAFWDDIRQQIQNYLDENFKQEEEK